MNPLDIIILIATAANVWMIYCIWFRREPASLMEVTMLCREKHQEK